VKILRTHSKTKSGLDIVPRKELSTEPLQPSCFRTEQVRSASVFNRLIETHTTLSKAIVFFHNNSGTAPQCQKSSMKISRSLQESFIPHPGKSYRHELRIVSYETRGSIRRMC
jgi:hypothetical protein